MERHIESAGRLAAIIASICVLVVGLTTVAMAHDGGGSRQGSSTQGRRDDRSHSRPSPKPTTKPSPAPTAKPSPRPTAKPSPRPTAIPTATGSTGGTSTGPGGSAVAGSTTSAAQAPAVKSTGTLGHAAGPAATSSHATASTVSAAQAPAGAMAASGGPALPSGGQAAEEFKQGVLGISGTFVPMGTGLVVGSLVHVGSEAGGLNTGQQLLMVAWLMANGFAIFLVRRRRAARRTHPSGPEFRPITLGTHNFS
ncbi:MAG: hypothetical protein QOK05_2463 [Chloroflexota bacterium]|nr:hypothetical protein [Chloroflexota bacterium]